MTWKQTESRIIDMSTTVGHITQILDRMAPPEWAEPWDHVGLQVGSTSANVKTIMTVLELTDPVLDEVLDTGAELVVLHHPLIFRPIVGLCESDPVEHRIMRLVRKKVSVYVAHTNFDASDHSMSALLLREAGVEKPKRVLPKPSVGNLKIAVFVPDEALLRVRDAMASKGAGVVGEYECCSFSVSGRGTFRGSHRSNPSIGEPGRLETVGEERLEMVCPKNRVPGVIEALVEAHPYEEPAFDIMPLLDFRHESHYIWIGDLPKAKSVSELLKPPVRVVGDPKRKVIRLAAVSGSGQSLIDTATKMGVEVLLTGDIRHHDARRAEDLGLSVLDVGHFRSEVSFGPIVMRLLKRELSGKSVNVCTSRRILPPWQPV